MTRYHFISGLPRSGSTLLSVLLRQNPALYAKVSGPLFYSTCNAMGTWNAMSVMMRAAAERMLRLIHELVGEPWFEHDFETAIFDAPDFDQQLGLPGLHRAQPKVQPVRRQTVLPPDLFERLDALSFWRDLSNSRARMIVAKREPHAAAAE